MSESSVLQRRIVTNGQDRQDDHEESRSQETACNVSPNYDAGLLEILTEEYTCGICHDLIVIPTTLTCGHSFCRPCLARWCIFKRKTECPNCRQIFVGFPSDNISVKSSLAKIFPLKYEKRRTEVAQDQDGQRALLEFETLVKEQDACNVKAKLYEGFMVGLCVTMAVVACMYYSFRYGNSDNDLLVRTPLIKWTTDDVVDWLNDIGLNMYNQTSMEHSVNGRMLLEITAEDLNLMFGMNNTVHQKTFLTALNYTKTHGTKPPTNLWEYKALYLGYTNFLVYSMGHSPRMLLLYLYLYDNETLHFFHDYQMNCERDHTINATIELSYWVNYLLLPQYAMSKFVWCSTGSELVYWTTRLLVFQFFIQGILEIIDMWSFIKGKPGFSILDFLVEAVLVSLLYYFVSLFWRFIPFIVQDALFYAEVYISPVFYLREAYRKIRILL